MPTDLTPWTSERQQACRERYSPNPAAAHPYEDNPVHPAFCSTCGWHQHAHLSRDPDVLAALDELDRRGAEIARLRAELADCEDTTTVMHDDLRSAGQYAERQAAAVAAAREYLGAWQRSPVQSAAARGRLREAVRALDGDGEGGG